jgi:hypothetical protein
VVGASNVLRHDWYIIVPVVLLGIYGIRRFKRTEPGRR